MRRDSLAIPFYTAPDNSQHRVVLFRHQSHEKYDEQERDAYGDWKAEQKRPAQIRCVLNAPSLGYDPVLEISAKILRPSFIARVNLLDCRLHEVKRNQVVVYLDPDE